MTPNDCPKLIYVAHRHPRFTHEAFIRRWRQHAALGMSQARWRNVTLYLHCDRIDGLPSAVPVIDCDGVAIVVYRSEHARQAHIADEPARRTMKQDELDTFAQPVANTSLLLREDVGRAGPPEGYRLFVFWSLAPGGDEARQPLDGAWRQLSAAANLAFTRNHPAGRIGDWACAYVDEVLCAELEPLITLAGNLDTTVEGACAVLTRTVVLHDARGS